MQPEVAGAPDALIRAVEAEGIRDGRILAAFRSIRRSGFVPAEHAAVADLDRPVPIPHGQVTTQPSLTARMIDGLRLTGHERVLEVGTGLGFQTALLARLAGPVYSVERFADLAEAARRNLRAAGVSGVVVVVGDGTLGLPEHAPFDAVLVSAAAPAVPDALARQLREGGRLVQPIGSGGAEIVTAFRKEGNRLAVDRRLTGAVFVPLVSGGG